VLGGEQSGHIIISDEGNVAGDGLYTALRVIEVMLDTGKPLSALCSLTKFPQAIVNVPSAAKPPLAGLKRLAAARSEVESVLAGRGRVNLRYSGTEPLLRIMIEGPTEAAVQAWADEIAASVREHLC
jgi:phosphoglucosamine mutase